MTYAFLPFSLREKNIPAAVYMHRRMNGFYYAPRVESVFVANGETKT
jgi:hypothetical protein